MPTETKPLAGVRVALERDDEHGHEMRIWVESPGPLDIDTVDATLTSHAPNPPRLYHCKNYRGVAWYVTPGHEVAAVDGLLSLGAEVDIRTDPPPIPADLGERARVGTPNGDTEAEVIATVYDEDHADLTAAAPELAEACRMALAREGDYLGACEDALRKAGLTD